MADDCEDKRRRKGSASSFSVLCYEKTHNGVSLIKLSWGRCTAVLSQNRNAGDCSSLTWKGLFSLCHYILNVNINSVLQPVNVTPKVPFSYTFLAPVSTQSKRALNFAFNSCYLLFAGNRKGIQTHLLHKKTRVRIACFLVITQFTHSSAPPE